MRKERIHVKMHYMDSLCCTDRVAVFSVALRVPEYPEVEAGVREELLLKGVQM